MKLILDVAPQKEELQRKLEKHILEGVIRDSNVNNTIKLEQLDRKVQDQIEKETKNLIRSRNIRTNKERRNQE